VRTSHVLHSLSFTCCHFFWARACKVQPRPTSRSKSGWSSACLLSMPIECKSMCVYVKWRARWLIMRYGWSLYLLLGLKYRGDVIPYATDGSRSTPTAHLSIRITFVRHHESAWSYKEAYSTQLQILEEIKKANSSISNFSTTFNARLTSFEKCLESVEQMQQEASVTTTDISSSTEKPKRKVPTHVTVSTI